MDKREPINHIHRIIHSLLIVLKTIKRLKSAIIPTKAKKNPVFTLAH